MTTPEAAQDFAARLKAEKERTGLTWKAMAQLLERTEHCLQMWCSLKANADVLTREGALARLARVPSKPKEEAPNV